MSDKKSTWRASDRRDLRGKGLAVALMAGEIASTLLSRMAVPVLYYMLARRFPPDRP